MSTDWEETHIDEVPVEFGNPENGHVGSEHCSCRPRVYLVTKTNPWTMETVQVGLRRVHRSIREVQADVY